jgi:anti-anti-sigma factor
LTRQPARDSELFVLPVLRSSGPVRPGRELCPAREVAAVTEIRYLVKLIDGMPVVRAPEEIDITVADQLHAVLLHAMSPGHATAVVDMTGTRFCDSSGLHALLRAHKRAQGEGGELRVVIAADGPVPRVFELSCVETVMPVFASVEEAVAGPPAATDQHPEPDAGQRQAGG